MKRFNKSWRFKIIFILSLFLLLSVNSCTKEEFKTEVNNLSVNEGITFRDGRLIFKDDSTYIHHLEWIVKNQADPQLIADWNKTLGLKSMTEYFDETMKLKETDPLFKTYIDKYPNIFVKVPYENSTLYFLPHSTLVCYVANKDGIYQVGNDIKRVTEYGIIQINDESKIDLLFLPKEEVLRNGIKVFSSKSDAKSEYCQATRYFSDHNFRMVSSLLQKPGEGIVRDIWEIWTHPQHKVLGIWYNADLLTKSAKGPGFYHVLGTNERTFWDPLTYSTEGWGIIKSFTYYGYHPDCLTNGDSSIPVDSYAPAYSRAKLNGQYIYTYWEDIFDFSPTHTYPNYLPGTPEPF